MWVKTHPSAQFFFQKLNVDNSCQKTRKVWYYIFEFLSSFNVLLKFVPNILASIIWRKKFFSHNLAQSLSHLNFWIVPVISKHFSNHDVNIKQVRSVESSKFNGFVLELFCILGWGQNLHLENSQFCPLVVFWMS